MSDDEKGVRIRELEEEARSESADHLDCDAMNNRTISELRAALRAEMEAHDYFMEHGRTKPGYTMEIWRVRRELVGLSPMGRRLDAPIVLSLPKDISNSSPEGDTE